MKLYNVSNINDLLNLNGKEFYSYKIESENGIIQSMIPPFKIRIKVTDRKEGGYNISLIDCIRPSLKESYSVDGNGWWKGSLPTRELYESEDDCISGYNNSLDSYIIKAKEYISKLECEKL